MVYTISHAAYRHEFIKKKRVLIIKKENVLIIPLPLMSLNKYTDEQRKHWSKGAHAKKKATLVCYQHALKAKNEGYTLSVPTRLVFTWYLADKRQDPDNIAFQKKFILDGMVQAGIIKNDGWQQITGFRDEFKIDKVNPRVEISAD